MKLLRLLAIALLAFTACGNDADTASQRATERLVAEVQTLRDAASAGDATSFAATTADLRSDVAAFRAGGQITDEKAASIEQQLAIVEAAFARTQPTTAPSTTQRPTTTSTTTTVASGDDETRGHGKRKKDD